MTDPILPHLLGVALDSTGIAYTQVIALNRTTGDRMIKTTDGSKLIIFNVANFDNGYSSGDVIEFENVGASHGGSTITISSPGSFQDTTITCVVAPTGNIII